jgi:phosphoribosylglycinamide formyltransferase-1
MRPSRVVILFSGSGTTLENLVLATRDGRLPGVEVPLAVSSRSGVGGIDRCERLGVPVAVVPRRPDPVTHTRTVFEMIDPERIDLVLLAGWMSRLVLEGPWLDGRVLNVHPSLLPAFGGPGMFGRHVHEAVLARGCKVTGCTVHAVDNEIDAGPIVAQQCVPVEPDDTADSLAARVQAVERTLYISAVREYLGRHDRPPERDRHPGR